MERDEGSRMITAVSPSEFPSMRWATKEGDVTMVVEEEEEEKGEEENSLVVIREPVIVLGTGGYMRSFVDLLAAELPLDTVIWAGREEDGAPEAALAALVDARRGGEGSGGCGGGTVLFYATENGFRLQADLLKSFLTLKDGRSTTTTSDGGAQQKETIIVVRETDERQGAVSEVEIRERLQKIAGRRKDDGDVVGAVIPFFADWAFRAVSIQKVARRLKLN